MLLATAIVEAGLVHCPEGRKLFPGMSVAKNLALGGYVHRRDGAGSRALLERVYAMFPILHDKRDDRAGSLGNVSFKVLVDGEARFESPAMGSNEPPRLVDVDLAGGKLLILITEFAERGDVQDSADWAEARIIR